MATAPTSIEAGGRCCRKWGMISNISSPSQAIVDHSRRRLLTWSLAGACLLTLASGASAQTSRGTVQKDWRQYLLDRDRYLSLERAGEKREFLYYRYGQGFQPAGYNMACHFLRDVESGGTTYRMNPKLLDLLYLIQGWLRHYRLPHHIVINSGYRTQAHNARLKGAAKESEHVKGNAADIRIPGLGTDALKRLARAIGVGGVGFYPVGEFVHVDVGRVREWRG